MIVNSAMVKASDGMTRSIKNATISCSTLCVNAGVVAAKEVLDQRRTGVHKRPAHLDVRRGSENPLNGWEVKTSMNPRMERQDEYVFDDCAERQSFC